MTKEEKELVLIDLSGRLRHGVYIRYGINGKSILTGIEHKKHPERWIIISEGSGHYLDDIKPYLRPMSSMTEEERQEYEKTCFFSNEIGDINTLESYDWLNKHHFDYRKSYDLDRKEWLSMIEKGLALKAPEGMYNF